jgi:hypothetical protein
MGRAPPIYNIACTHDFRFLITAATFRVKDAAVSCTVPIRSNSVPAFLLSEFSFKQKLAYADPGGRAGFRPLAGCECVFESPWGHCCLVNVVFSGRNLCVGSISLPGESYQDRERKRERVCECELVSVSVISCNNKPLHPQWVGKRGQSKKESLHTLKDRLIANDIHQ